jgi:protocatechuate 3,4-dioxygenase beta subunit
MERKNFIKSLIIGSISAPIFFNACKKSANDSATDSQGTPGNVTSSNADCQATPVEIEGPFPTNVPNGLLRSDIGDGRSGHVMRARINVRNANNNCAALQGAIVDIWHCDADGNYSEYGGTNSQSANFRTVHFLRGRQITDTSGSVVFNSIFPGWYPGRATHIHVHIYNAAGTSLIITQIAFPEGNGTALALVNGYNKGMGGYTYNNADTAFSDDRTGVEIATVTGNLSTGFDLNCNVNVRV